MERFYQNTGISSYVKTNHQLEFITWIIHQFQVEVLVNDVPSRCDASFDKNQHTSCAIKWSELHTPLIEQVEVAEATIATRKKRETNTLTVTADDEITVTGGLINHKRKNIIVFDLFTTPYKQKLVVDCAQIYVYITLV